MRSSIRLGLAFFGALALFATFAGTSFAAGTNSHDSGHVVFVLTDNPSGNQVVAYDRAADGSLTQVGAYSTGGTGGVLDGSVVDHTASQGALAYDSSRGLLFAVNAGSSTVSVFRCAGRPPRSETGRRFRWNVPGQRCRPRRARLRPQCSERRLRAGLRRLR